MFVSSIRMTALALLAVTSFAIAAPAPAPIKQNPGGIVARLVNNKDSYTIDPAQTGQAFRDSLKNNKGRAPATPAVDLVLQLSNTTTLPITLNIGGDNTQLVLKLEGPGAVTIQNNVAMTMEFRMGNPTVIAPGKTLDIKITSLSFGMRGISQAAYWTEPGDYMLTASWISNNENNTTTTYASEPTKIKVAK